MSLSSETRTFALGPTVGAALGQALPGLLRTGLTAIPISLFAIVLTTTLTVTTLAYVVVMLTWAPTANISNLPLVHGIYSVLAFLTLPLATCVLAPLQTAMSHSHWKHLRDDVDLGIMDGMRGGFSNPPLLFWMWAYLTCTVFGYLCFVIPGLLIEAAFGFVAPAMIVHQLTFRQAIARSLRHFIDAPMWHLGLTVIDQLLAMALGSLIPILGTGLGVSFSLHVTLRAYVEAYPATAALIELPE
ncbi:MAG: hypothetical protein AB8H79_03455 [Myxococcota bacterium]